MSRSGPRRLLRPARLALALFLIAWLGAFVATHIPARSIPQVHASDKVLHATGFFILGGLLLLALAIRGARRWRRDLAALVLLAAYAAFDELTQPLVGRTAALGDWLADVTGLVAALIVGEMIAAIAAARARSRAGTG